MIPEIIYEDEETLVVYKPAGMAVQTNRVMQQDLVGWLRNYRAGREEDVYIGTVHRLDQPVEGVLVFAKTKAAAGVLSKQIRKGQMRKEYLAVVRGGLPTQGIMEDYLCHDAKAGCARVVPSGAPGAKRARLSYRILDVRGERSLVSVRLDTGRFHQIRVQFAERGAPILGDIKYGSREASGSLALCAVGLEFGHPRTHRRMRFCVEPKGTYFWSGNPLEHE